MRPERLGLCVRRGLGGREGAVPVRVRDPGRRTSTRRSRVGLPPVLRGRRLGGAPGRTTGRDRFTRASRQRTPGQRVTAAPPARAPALELVPSQEETLLRETVRSICSDFGPRYSREKTAAGEPPTELWDALASRGYLGVNIPEEYGGGGLGMSALAAVGEEISTAGCSLLLIVVSPAIVGSILVRHATPEQKDTWLPGLGAGTTKV